VERLSLNFLPPVVHRLLFSQSEEFPGGRLLLRALYGAASGTVLFLGLCHSLPLTFDLQLAAAAVFIGPLSNIQSNVEAAALSLSCNLDLQIHHSKVLWRETLSPYILISQQLMQLMVTMTTRSWRDPDSLHPHLSAAHGNYDSKVLWRETLSPYILISQQLMQGPLERDSESLHPHLSAAHGNYDSKVLWRETLSPYILISQQLMDEKEEFQSEVRSVSRTFQQVRDQVVGQYGYNGFNRKYSAGTGSSTQDNRKYSAGTGSSTHDNRKYSAGTGSSTQDNRKYKAGTGSSTQDNRKYKAGTGSSTQDNREYKAGTGSSTQDNRKYSAGTGSSTH
ncbi:hypothetical protein KUCAC02_037916, partial [Chaenocephalus aceratus]